MRYDKLFSSLKAKNEGAFIPFAVLGDPGKTASLEALEALIEGGADALELGFPFSDPLADGPAIQAADIRALAAGTRADDCFEIIAEIRRRHDALPIGLLVYANLICRRGTEKFFRDARDAGADALLIADVPVEMSAPFREISEKTGLPLVFIAPPNADEATLADVAKFGNGYTYVLSRAGVTGAETRAGTPTARVLSALKRFGAPPPVLGFGISEPEQVRAAIEAGTAGAISGSAVARLIEKHAGDSLRMREALRGFARAMKAATRRGN